jgi:hypothetical protein
MIAPAVARLLSVISVGMLVSFVKVLLGWIDHRIAAPVMKERFNSASDAFFIEDGRNWGEIEPDNMARFKAHTHV